VLAFEQIVFDCIAFLGAVFKHCIASNCRNSSRYQCISIWC